jgi:hypothetical protein
MPVRATATIAAVGPGPRAVERTQNKAPPPVAVMKISSSIA